MQESRFPQPLDQMERVSRADLSYQLNNILEIIDRDNVGYVIADEGKNNLVLCPARWFNWANYDLTTS